MKLIIDIILWLSIIINISSGIFSQWALNRKRKELQSAYNELVKEVNDHIKEFNDVVDSSNFDNKHKITEKVIH